MPENTLRELTAYRQIFKVSGDGTFEWDIATNKSIYSENWFRMLGYPPVPGVTDEDYFIEFLHPDDLPRVRDALKRHWDSLGRIAYHIQVRMRRSSGDYAMILIRGGSIFSDTGKPLRMYGVHTDITRFAEAFSALKKSMEDSAAAAQNQAQIVTMASHEFRTPLSVLNSSLELLALVAKRENVTFFEKIRKPFERASTASKELETIVTDILGLAKSAQDQYIPKYAPCNLKELIMDIATEATIQESAASYRLVSSIGFADDVIGMVDPFALKLACLNLIHNSLKFSTGAVHLKVSYQDDLLKVEVTDFGIGILPEEIDQIFEVKFRGKNAADYDGNGFGLPLSKKLITACGGEISAKSTPNTTTTFTLTLPIGACVEISNR